jgi:uncharacterized membrane protein
MKFKETNTRSITKSVTYRIIVVIADTLVIYALTKKVSTTIALTIFTNLSTTVLYFLHERFWNGIAWGRQRAR